MVARLSIANEDRVERSNTTDVSPVQAELDTNAKKDPVVPVITNKINEIPRQEKILDGEQC